MALNSQQSQNMYDTATGQTVPAESKVKQSSAPVLLERQAIQEFEEMGAEDIAIQKGEQKQPSADEAFQNLLSSTSFEEIEATGYSRIGSVALDPSYLEQARTDQKTQAMLYENFMKEYKVPTVEPQKLPVQFSSADYQTTRLPAYFDKYPERIRDKLEAMIETDQSVAKVLEESTLPMQGKELLLNEFISGSLSQEVMRTWRDIPSDITQTLPTLVGMGADAAQALYNAAGTWGDDDRSFKETFINTYSYEQEQTYSALKKWSYDPSNASVIAASADQRIASWYKDKFIDKYTQEGWNAAHTEPATEVKFDENGEVAGVDYVYDDDGKLVYKDNVDPAVFGQLISNSFDSLTSGEKALMFFLSDAPMVQFGVARNVAKGQAWFDNVQAARKSDPERFGADMSDWDVHTALLKQNHNTTVSYALRGLNRLLHGKGAIERGQVMSSHLSNLADMQSNIKDLKNKLSTLENQKAAMLSKGRTPNASVDSDIQNLENQIEFLERSRIAYSNRSGGGRFINPYSKNALVDDIYISAALGYLPEYGGMAFERMGFDEQTGDVLTSIAAPFVAPATGRGLVKGVKKVGTKVPIAKEGITAITDLASALENSSWLPFVNVGTLVKGDTAEIKAAAQATGVELSDQSVQAITLFSKVLRSAETDVDIGGGKRVNMQKRIYDSLVNYSNVMQRTRKRMENITDNNGSRVFTDDEIQENMSNLHLSLAHASGIAPLIAIQEMRLGNIKPGSVMKEKTLQDAFAAVIQEETVLDGMDTQLRILTASFASKGVELDSNDPIQQTIEMLDSVTQKGRDNLNLKKQELDNVITAFINDPAGVNEDQFGTLVNLRIMQMDADVRNVADRAVVAEELAVEIMDSAEQRLVAVQRLSGDMLTKEVQNEVEEVAGQLFDTVMNLRKERGSARYKDVNTYADENNITIDMGSLVNKMLDMDAELTGNDITYFLKGGKKFLATDGMVLKRTFNSMAMRGLVERYGDKDGVREIIFAAFENGQIDRPTATDFALFAAEKATDGDVFRFFKGTVEEVEDVRRFFRDRAISSESRKGIEAKGVGALDREFEGAVDTLIEEADDSGRLMLMVDTARVGWKQDVGDVTEMGTYAGTVTRGTKRDETFLDEAATEEAGEVVTTKGRTLYTSPNANPVKPFNDIAKSFRSVIGQKDPKVSADSIAEIRNNMDRLMQFLGAEMKEGVRVFNLSDPKQRKAARLFGQLLETQLNKEAQLELDSLFGFVTPESRAIAEGLGTDAEALAKASASRLLGDAVPDFDFSRGERMLRIEKELQIPVIRNADSTVEFRTSHTTALKGEFADVDELLETKTKWKNGYEEIRRDANNLESPLRIAATREFEKEEEAIRKLEQARQNAKDPAKFFEQNFETATPGSIQKLRIDLISSGLSAEEVDMSLKAMYTQGVMQKAKHRFFKGSGFNDAKQEVQDLDILIDYVENPKYRQNMEAVLGKEHAQHLEDIASWAKAAKGDGAGFRAMPDTKGMSIDSAIARFFNLSRGLVSPQYVATEVGLRVLLKRRQELVKFALADRGAAGIIGKILQTPKAITNDDIKLLGARIRTYIIAGEGGLLRSEGEIPALDIFLGATATETITEKQAQELQELQQELREAAEEQNNEQQ